MGRKIYECDECLFGADKIGSCVTVFEGDEIERTEPTVVRANVRA